MHKQLFTVMSASLISLGIFASSAQAVTNVVSFSGEASPDGIGTFYVYDAPIINRSGSVAYWAVLQGSQVTPDNGIFRSQGGVLNLVVRTNSAVPGGSGIFKSLGLETLGNNGGVLFGGSIGGSDSGMYLQNASGSRRLLHLGQPAASGPGTLTNFSGISTLPGSTSFVTAVDFTDSHNQSTSNTGIYLQGSSNFQQLVHKGQTAPPGGTYDSFLTMDSPAANTRGQTAFNATLLGRKYSQPNQDGIYLTDPQNILLQIARQGQVAFGTTPFAAFRGAPEVNASGKVAFVADLTGSGGFTDSYGVFIGDGHNNPFITVMHRGDAAPDGNGQFDGRLDGVLAKGITDSGEVAFASNLMNTTAGFNDDSGLFVGNGSSIRQIVREGQSVPDGNGKFGDLYSSNRGLVVPTADNATINQAGVVAFVGNLTNTSGGFSDNQGIYLSDGHEMIKVIRKGDTLNGSTVSFLNVDFAGPHPVFSTTTGKLANTGMGFNDNGQVAYRAALTNGNEGVFLFTPELHLHTLSASTPIAWERSDAWTLGLSPGAPHTVLIDTGAGASVIGPTVNTTINALTIGTDTGGSDTLRLSGGGELSVTQGVTIYRQGKLFGTNTLHADVSNDGLISPGNSPGQLTIDGNYTQDINGILLMELAGLTPGSGYDSLNVTGNVDLSGVLDITLSGGFTLAPGDNFDLITAALIQGSFSTINLPTIKGLHLSLLQNANHITLQVTSAVPVPAAAWLFGSGLIALSGLARRKATI